jgi:hypothetical protein
MAKSADVKSVDAIREFKNDLIVLQTALRQTVEHLLQEMRRGLEWLESDRATYWPAQVSKASDAVAEARINLQRCMLTARPDERRSCYDERKALERARMRLAYAEQQVRKTRGWIRAARREAEEFQTRLARLSDIPEGVLPSAIALLEKTSRSLETYVGRGAAVKLDSRPADGGGEPNNEVPEPDDDAPPDQPEEPSS